jgi:sugar phosphate isomerase/epimerase
MILAISGQALSRYRSLDEILTLCKQLEIRWIELWPLNLEGGGPDPERQESRYEGKDIARARQVLSVHGIGVACVTMPGAFFAKMVADPADYLSALKTAVDVAVALASRLVNSYCYHFALGHEAGIEPLVRVLRPAAAYAAERGVTLVLENEAHDASATVAGMLRILEAVGSEAMKTNFDSCNYYQATEEAYPLGYRRLKQHIGYMHLKNGCLFDPESHPENRRRSAVTGRPGEHYIYYPPLPEGAVNIEGLVAQLARDRYKGFCTLEPHVPLDLLEEYYRVEAAYARRLGVE